MHECDVADGQNANECFILLFVLVELALYSHGDNESSDEELSDSEDDGGENNDDVDDDSDGEEDEDDEEEDGEVDDDDDDDGDDEEYTSGAESGESTSEDDISDHEDIDEVIRHRNSNNNNDNHNGVNMNGIMRSNTHESRLLFQIYLARIFAHNVNVAFRDVVALQAQKELLEECEIDEKMKSSKQQQNKNAKKQNSKQKQKAKQQQQQQKKNASQTTKTPPTVVSKKEQQREVIPPLDILLHEASSVMMSEEIEDDEWNVVQAKSKLPRQARYSSPHESDDSPRYDSISDDLPSRSVSPALSTTSTISIVSSGSVSGSVTTVSSSSTSSNKKKKKKQRAQEAIAKQIDFDATAADSSNSSTRAHTTKELNPDAESFVPYATMTVTAMTGAAPATTANNNHQGMMVPSSNAYSFFSDIDFMLNDSYMTPRNRQVDYDDAMYGRGIPPIGYELRSNNNTNNNNNNSEEEQRRRHTVEHSFNPFTLPTFFPLVNRMF